MHAVSSDARLLLWADSSPGSTALAGHVLMEAGKSEALQGCHVLGLLEGLFWMLWGM